MKKATQIGAVCIITRDASHFPKDEVPVLSPADYLEMNL